MKTSFFALILAAIIGTFLSVPAFAADPIYAWVPLCTLTNTAAGTATNLPTGGNTLDCRKQSSVAVQISQTLDGNSTDPLGYFFQRSVDGTNWSVPGQYVTVASVNLTRIVTITNIPTYGAGYVKLTYMTNVGAAAATNVFIRWAQKLNVP